MKFNIQYVKKNPVMFGVILLVFGLGLWLLMNKHGAAAPAAGGTAVVNAGPSDTQVQAATALGIAQIQAGAAAQQTQAQLAAAQDSNAAQVAVASLSAQLQGQQAASAERVANRTTDAQLAALTSQLDTSLAINRDNNSTTVALSKNATDAAITSLAIGSDLQKTLSADQLKAFETSSFLTAIPSLKYASYAKYLIADAAAIAVAPPTNGAIPGQQSTGAHV